MFPPLHVQGDPERLWYDRCLPATECTGMTSVYSIFKSRRKPERLWKGSSYPGEYGTTTEVYPYLRVVRLSGGLGSVSLYFTVERKKCDGIKIG